MGEVIVVKDQGTRLLMALGQKLRVVRAPLEVPQWLQGHQALHPPTTTAKSKEIHMQNSSLWLMPASYKVRRVLPETDKKSLPVREAKELEALFQELSGGQNPVPDPCYLLTDP